MQAFTALGSRTIQWKTDGLKFWNCCKDFVGGLLDRLKEDCEYNLNNTVLVLQQLEASIYSFV